MIVAALANTLTEARGRAKSSENEVHRCHCVGFSHSLHPPNESALNGSRTETQHRMMCLSLLLLAVVTKCK